MQVRAALGIRLDALIHGIVIALSQIHVAEICQNPSVRQFIALQERQTCGGTRGKLKDLGQVVCVYGCPVTANQCQSYLHGVYACVHGILWSE